MDNRKNMEKQNGKTLSRKHLFALWGTLITVLGTAVVPKIIDALSDRPSVVDVQDMIAKQTKALTEATTQNMVTIEKLRDAAVDLQTQLAKIEGCVDTMEKVVRDCCTRSVVHVMSRPASVPRVLHVKLPEEKDGSAAEEISPEKPVVKMLVRDSPVQNKLPEFKAPWLQQAQQPE